MKFGTGVTGIARANDRTGGRLHRREIHGSLASAFVDLGTGAGIDRASQLTQDTEVNELDDGARCCTKHHPENLLPSGHGTKIPAASERVVGLESL